MKLLLKVILILSLLVNIGLGVYLYNQDHEHDGLLIYKEFFDKLPGMAFVKDKQSNVIDINNNYDNMLESLGYTPEQIIGTKGDLFGERAKRKFVAHDKMVINKGSLITFEEVVPNYGVGSSYKFPLRDEFGFIIGTGGVWILEEKIRDER